MKKYLISIVTSFGLILISSLILNIFYYFDIFNNTLYKILLIIFNSLIIGFSSYILGKNTNEKGYIEGLKFGLIIALIMFLLSLIFFRNIELGMIIYYIIIIIVSVIGSMIGINKKKN